MYVLYALLILISPLYIILFILDRATFKRVFLGEFNYELY